MAYISFQPNDYFNTKLYTGTGSAQSITGVGFQPDFVWNKARNAGEDHCVTDAVRGVTEAIFPSDYAAYQVQSNGLTAFGSDGYTVGSDGYWGYNGRTYASWNWKANGQGSANTSGSINTAYTSANTTSGFSICKWVGTQSTGTIAHGLGKVPKVIFVKNTDSTDSWNVFAKTGYMNENYRLLLDTTGARIADGDAWNSQVPTSSYFTVGSNTGTNKSGSTIIAYVFAEVQGFSKFSEYVGNGNADGAFVNTGFKPAWVMTKPVSGAGSWYMLDNKRANPFNAVTGRVEADGSGAENTGFTWCDFTSNGFKIRTTEGGINANGVTYLYMAFAEKPLVSSNGVAATAR